jgi:DNA-binding MarR family transcriptional regulator
MAMAKSDYKNDASPNEKLMLTIVRLSEQYKKDCSLIFSRYGLTFPQYNVLRILDGSENKRNTISRVGKLMLVSGANMTGIAKRLERDGFLVRKGVPEDARIAFLEITTKGKQTLATIATHRDALIDHYLSDYDEETRQRLRSILRDCLRKVTDR